MTNNSTQKASQTVSVIGLGYVGLPLALALARKTSVIGFDINSSRIELLKRNIDPSNELDKEAFQNTNIFFTDQTIELKKASIHIVAVPTPIDKSNKPDIRILLKATETVGQILKKGDVVIFESTVYPGCTEEDCIPLLEKLSGLKLNDDFKVGYSPERINPGDKVHTLEKTVKVVSGSDAVALEKVAEIYEQVVDAGVHKASSIKVAEAAKIIENTQRDVNIALMNELALIFDRMEIDTQEVLKAAGTKWNFLKFYPGLVGGHCIGVDPYYLIHKAKTFKYHPQVIGAGRYINDKMGQYIGQQTIKKLIGLGKNISESRVLVMGITFKENVSDIRNSKVLDIIEELKDYRLSVDVTDPKAMPEEVKYEYGIELTKFDEIIPNSYDALILAVSHEEYINFSENELSIFLKDNALIVDVKSLLKNKISQHLYWNL